MRRRSFVLLMLVILAGFWTPPQATTAQTGCPEASCKTFLPVVHTPVYATARAYSVSQTKRGCDEQWTGVELTNVANVPITDVAVKGFYLPGDPEFYPGSTYSITTTDVLFPGETFKYPVELDRCSGSGGFASTNVYGAVPVANVAPLAVTTKAVQWSCGAGGQRYYATTLELQNEGATTLTDIKAFLSIYIASQRVDIDVPSLAPGATTTVNQSLLYIDDWVGDCGSAPSMELSAHAWGTITP